MEDIAVVQVVVDTRLEEEDMDNLENIKMTLNDYRNQLNSLGRSL